jgi:amidase
VTIKDQYATKGLRTTNGYLPQADYVADEDATVVARLKEAGAIVLGKTNQPVLGMDVQSANPIFATTNNPWDLGRTPDGSSGGESAAIAAGLSPLGMGADIGGSIRIPAHFTGIFGLKPTEGRVSGAGMAPGLPGPGFQSWLHRISYGPLARSIEDLALAFSIIAGADVRDVDVPGLPVVYPDPKPPRALRIGWTDEFPKGRVSEDTRAVLGAFIASLEKAGFPIERATPSLEDLVENWRVYGDLNGMEIGGGLAVMPLFRFLLRRDTIAFPFSLENYKKTLNSRAEVIARMETFLSSYDLFVCPVSFLPAFEHQAVRHHASGRRPAGALLGCDSQLHGPLQHHRKSGRRHPHRNKQGGAPHRCAARRAAVAGRRAVGRRPAALFRCGRPPPPTGLRRTLAVNSE